MSTNPEKHQGGEMLASPHGRCRGWQSAVASPTMQAPLGDHGSPPFVLDNHLCWILE